MKITILDVFSVLHFFLLVLTSVLQVYYCFHVVETKLCLSSRYCLLALNLATGVCKLPCFSASLIIIHKFTPISVEIAIFLTFNDFYTKQQYFQAGKRLRLSALLSVLQEATFKHQLLIEK